MYECCLFDYVTQELRTFHISHQMAKASISTEI